MKSLLPTIEKFGDLGLRFKWKAEIDASVHAEIVSWRNQINVDFGKRIEDVTIAYNELVVYLNEDGEQESLKEELGTMKLRKEFRIAPEKKEKIYIPVCYEGEYSLDGETLCNNNSLSKEELIELHTTAEYPVYFIGFLPGFPYLGGLDKKLHHARKSSPRKSVPKGAVGIAGGQTGIYPSPSPGGWNIIGRSAMPILNVNDGNVTLLNPGDVIIFYKINMKIFNELEKELSAYSLSELRDSSHKLYEKYHDRN